jgi:hypothetical protein
MKNKPSKFPVFFVLCIALAVPAFAAKDSTVSAAKTSVPAQSKSADVTRADSAGISSIVDSQTAAVPPAMPKPLFPLHAAIGTMSVESLRADAARLRAEAKMLRDLADTLNRSSDEAEKRAVEAQQKAEKLQLEIGEQDVRRAAGSMRSQIERIKRLIQADVERVKRTHGVKTAGDSVYEFQADSIDSVLSHVATDTSTDLDKQKKLAREIQENSRELLKKSREMSVKARELEETAGKREDLAEDLSEKANRLAEDQNPVVLSKRFPLHFGFQFRLTDVGPYNQQKVDILFLHGLSLSYTFTKYIDAGLQDVMVYWAQTPNGQRYAITASPSVKAAFFPVKRLQIGAVAGVSVQGRVGAGHKAQAGLTPFLSLFNEVWVRNHFSISPLIRLSYAAYGPYYTVALSQHSGVLPQGALWLDVGMGYTFNF